MTDASALNNATQKEAQSQVPKRIGDGTSVKYSLSILILWDNNLLFPKKLIV